MTPTALVGRIMAAMNELRVYDRISDAVGWTPLVRLDRSVSGLGSEVFAKIEFMNPMGSVKDRIARYMVEKALREGMLDRATWSSRTPRATPPWGWR